MLRVFFHNTPNNFYHKAPEAAAGFNIIDYTSPFNSVHTQSSNQVDAAAGFSFICTIY